MKTTTTTTTTKQSRHAETLARLRSFINAAGHRPPPGMRARLNLAAIRERKATEQRKARTLARMPAPEITGAAVYAINWSSAAA